MQDKKAQFLTWKKGSTTTTRPHWRFEVATLSNKLEGKCLKRPCVDDHTTIVPRLESGDEPIDVEECVDRTEEDQNDIRHTT